MSKELDLKQKNELARAVFQDLLKWKTIGGLSYLKVGQLLKRFKDEELYKYLGEGSEEFESFEAFLKIPEINMELRKAYYLIQIWTTFVEKYGFKEEELADIPWTSLRVLLPVVRKENVRDLVEKARNLNRTHLEMEIKALKSGLVTLDDLSNCKHEWEEITFWRCRKCGERSKVKPTDGKIV
ncbi:MAG: hypothetical protein ACTSR2_01855 [Candidatus Hodarchaeales archaeon]